MYYIFQILKHYIRYGLKLTHFHIDDKNETLGDIKMDESTVYMYLQKRTQICNIFDRKKLLYYIIVRGEKKDATTWMHPIPHFRN